jgi:tetratricopeptide (TPR) repeat protein
MTKNTKQILITLVLVVCGFGIIFLLSNYLEKNRPPLPENYEDEDLSLQGAKLKNYSLGFNGLLADWYWMRSLQYIGDKILKNPQENINIEDLRPLNPRLLYPLLESTTDLDPHFIAAFAYGAVVLPAIDSTQAIKIAEKGITNNPNEWRLYQHLGYIYWRLQNYEKAAQVYEEGSKIQGAPPFMKMMVAQMKNKGGSRETSRQIYEQMLAEAQDDITRKAAQLRLSELDSLDERDAVQATLDAFKSRQNRCPSGWAEIFPILKEVKLPGGKDFRIDRNNNLIDPSGAPYILDTKSCRILLDAQKTKIPLN